MADWEEVTLKQHVERVCDLRHEREEIEIRAINDRVTQNRSDWFVAHQEIAKRVSEYADAIDKRTEERMQLVDAKFKELDHRFAAIEGKMALGAGIILTVASLISLVARLWKI